MNERVERVVIDGQVYDRWTVWEDDQHNKSGYRLRAQRSGRRRSGALVGWKLPGSGLLISLMIMALTMMVT